MATKNRKAAMKRFGGIESDNSRAIVLPPVCEGERKVKSIGGPLPEVIPVKREEKRYRIQDYN